MYDCKDILSIHEQMFCAPKSNIYNIYKLQENKKESKNIKKNLETFGPMWHIFAI